MLPSEESFFTLLFAFPDGGWKSDQMCELRTFFKSVGLRIWCLVGGMEWWALLHSILQWHQVCWMPSEFVYLSFNSGFKGDSLPKKQRNNFKSGVYILDQICIAAVIVCNSATLAILFVSWNHSRASIWCCDVCECFSLLKPFVSVTWVTCWSAAKKHSRGRDFWKQCRAAELGNARCFSSGEHQAGGFKDSLFVPCTSMYPYLAPIWLIFFQYQIGQNHKLARNGMKSSSRRCLRCEIFTGSLQRDTESNCPPFILRLKMTLQRPPRW